MVLHWLRIKHSYEKVLSEVTISALKGEISFAILFNYMSLTQSRSIILYQHENTCGGERQHGETNT